MHRTIALPVLLGLLATLILTISGCTGSTQTLETSISLPENLTPLRTDLTITPLVPLNSPRDDFGATMPLDTSIIFFTSGRAGATGKHSIYWSRLNGMTWGSPQLAVEVNESTGVTDPSNGMPTISPGGQDLYFTGCNFGFGDCDLYYVSSGPRGSITKETVPWMIPRNAGLGINSSYWDSQPSISSDGSLLVFSSDRPGGFGGRDIWLMIREQDGSWSAPINAGGNVNTRYDEITPWIAPDLRTLYFSSNGHPGIDGFDIFFVHLEPQSGLRVISDAQNLGRPINSSAHDIAFSLSADGSHAFFASNRPGGLGGYDIYQINEAPIDIEPLTTVRGTVVDRDGKPLLADIEVIDLDNGNVIGRFQTDGETGEYRLVLRRGYDYAVAAQAPQHLFDTRMISVPLSLGGKQEVSLSHRLQPMNGWVRLLVFYDPGSTILERNSAVDLDRVVTFLQANKEVNVEIGGHTDNTGDEPTNQQLSYDRAESVKKYLVGNQIAANRITVKGYGSSKPIADNSTDDGRALNRRVEMRIIAQ